jgi:hypothetical protein
MTHNPPLATPARSGAPSSNSVLAPCQSQRSCPNAPWLTPGVEVGCGGRGRRGCVGRGGCGSCGGAPLLASFARGGRRINHLALRGGPPARFRRDQPASRSHSHYAARYSDHLPERYYPNPRVKWRRQHPHIRKERECAGHRASWRDVASIIGGATAAASGQ